MKSVVAGNDRERDAGRVEPAGRFGHGRAGPGPGHEPYQKGRPRGRARPGFCRMIPSIASLWKLS